MSGRRRFFEVYIATCSWTAGIAEQSELIFFYLIREFPTLTNLEINLRDLPRVWQLRIAAFYLF